MNIKHLFALCLFGLTSLPGVASAQNQLRTPISAEVLPGWQQADGSRIAAIRFTLAPGWKTYWRAPGEGGIPPQFKWGGSKNLSDISILWPTPQVFHQNGMRTIGYEDELILPLRIDPPHDGKPVQLSGEVDLGVCKDICVPKTLRFEGVLEGASPTPMPAIAASLAARPYSAREAGVRSATCAVQPNQYGLEIEATLNMPQMSGREVVVIESGNAEVWSSETDVTRRGSTLTARGDMMSASGGAFALDRSSITITVLGKRQAVEIKGCAPD